MEAREEMDGQTHRIRGRCGQKARRNLKKKKKKWEKETMNK